MRDVFCYHNKPMPDIALIPTLNEAENIVLLIGQIRRAVPDVHILVVDDESLDGTASAVRGLEEKSVSLLLRRDRGGYASAILDGFQLALEMSGTRIVTMDADFSHDPRDIPRLLRLGGQHDLVIGSRYCGGRRVLNWSWKRLALSVVANWYVKELLRLPFSDCTSGFRCYSRRLVEDVILPLIFHSDGYAFLVEVLFHVHRSQASIAESPIVFTERREGQSKMTNGMIAEAALLPLRLLLRSNKTSDGR